MQYSGKCNGCGLCCWPGGQRCRHLQLLGNGKTFCKAYPNHLGKHLGGGYICNNIMDVPYLYDGCPYNDDKIQFMLNGGKYEKVT